MIEKITINMHSSIRVQGERVIYFDPYGIKEESHDADVIFITHDHYDHFDPESINNIIRDDTLLIIPRTSMQAWSESGIIATQLVQMDPGQEIDLFGLLIETVPAYNHVKPYHPRRNGWLGYIVTTDNRRIYVTGDTDLTPEARLVECDILFVPVGGKFTMNYTKAAELANSIKPDIAVPTHYGSIVGKPGDGRAFKELVDDEIIVPLLIRHTPEAEQQEPAAEHGAPAEAGAAEETIEEASAAQTDGIDDLMTEIKSPDAEYDYQEPTDAEYEATEIIEDDPMDETPTDYEYEEAVEEKEE